MIRRPPRSTRTDHSFPTRRSSDLLLQVGQMVEIVAHALHPRRRLLSCPARPGSVAPPGWTGHFHERARHRRRSEEHTSELQSLMRISYAVFCLKKKK